MNVIYEPSGKAKEYSDLALNIYKGCPHGCLYCYVPSATFKKRDAFHANVTPRKDILEKIRSEVVDHKGKEVLLCFTCDPYPPEEMKFMITRQAIKELHGAGVAVNLLTKGGHRAQRDFDLLIEHPELSKLGATLTFDNWDDSKKWEPQAECYSERLQMLYEAKLRGIRTWASLEPVIEPEQTLNLIKMSAEFVDHFKVGRWNYDQRANEINWKKFVHEAVELLEKLGASYYIKKDLAVFLDKAMG